jgi:hypothetical protein
MLIGIADLTMHVLNTRPNNQRYLTEPPNTILLPCATMKCARART